MTDLVTLTGSEDQISKVVGALRNGTLLRGAPIAGFNDRTASAGDIVVVYGGQYRADLEVPNAGVKALPMMADAVAIYQQPCKKPGQNPLSLNVSWSGRLRSLKGFFDRVKDEWRGPGPLKVNYSEKLPEFNPTYEEGVSHFVDKVHFTSGTAIAVAKRLYNLAYVNSRSMKALRQPIPGPMS